MIQWVGGMLTLPVFLRVLEYYRGVIFLTTNRLTTIDAAFSSRIHLALKYSALESPAREELWTMFLQQTQNHGDAFSKATMSRWSALRLNGRQIKNTVKTANILAHSENRYISEEDIDSVLVVLQEFEEELSGKGSSHAADLLVVNGENRATTRPSKPERPLKPSSLVSKA
jgi:hypothetical protein